MTYSGHAASLSFGMSNLEGVEFVETECTCDVGCDSTRTAGALNTADAVCCEISDNINLPSYVVP